jgi:hypothetical protein
VDGDFLKDVTDVVVTAIQKLFLIVASGNFIAGILACLEVVPKIAPAVSLFFVVWVGILAVKEKQKSIKLKDMAINSKKLNAEEA